ncbi:hypothetical protein HDG34_005638 [Paraburkholderia sp. HC6.4b]|uniref:hypothetical protein n=1 Tax=unclassified Paraburkholderia TaxID=2615204 RepID=UPI001615B10D|nr:MULTISPECIES: hypothetical protein [unclassified Paraburkholderia]MBB5411677.1 hypothetical protein [Paraburkholderia sp. HC6.4b]MBB5453294.1 hypothetical protein [Paraburkholderia sp. Kb1A]MBC8729420.1 hypothetical protein [Paraburkholderia sp. UCT2]
MKDTYCGTAAALRDALSHAVLRGGASSLKALHQSAPGDDVLTGTDATAQAARIRYRLDRLTDLQRALLVVSYAPQNITCACHRPCCAGHYPNPEWSGALAQIVAHTAPLFIGHVPNIRLRSALVANILTHTGETQVSLAQRCGVHRQTVAEHTAILGATLSGTRQKSGEFDAAFGRIDALLREAGIVRDESASDVTNEETTALACRQRGALAA